MIRARFLDNIPHNTRSCAYTHHLMQFEAQLHSGNGESDLAFTATTLKIFDLSAFLGLPAPTVRSWERRQCAARGLPRPARRPLADAKTSEASRVPCCSGWLSFPTSPRDRRAVGPRTRGIAACGGGDSLTQIGGSVVSVRSGDRIRATQ